MEEKKGTGSEQQEVIPKYACPMHCEGDKMYDQPGKCPTLRDESGKGLKV